MAERVLIIPDPTTGQPVICGDGTVITTIPDGLSSSDCPECETFEECPACEHRANDDPDNETDCQGGLWTPDSYLVKLSNFPVPPKVCLNHAGNFISSPNVWKELHLDTDINGEHCLERGGWGCTYQKEIPLSGKINKGSLRQCCTDPPTRGGGGEIDWSELTHALITLKVAYEGVYLSVDLKGDNSWRLYGHFIEDTTAPCSDLPDDVLENEDTSMVGRDMGPETWKIVEDQGTGSGSTDCEVVGTLAELEAQIMQECCASSGGVGPEGL